jgi:hypothetical protein
MQIETTIAHVRAIVDAIWAQFGHNLAAICEGKDDKTLEVLTKRRRPAKRKQRGEGQVLLWRVCPWLLPDSYNFLPGSPPPNVNATSAINQLLTI